MALFGSKKKTEETKPETKAETTTKSASSAPRSSSIGTVAHVLKNPRITEKASDMQAMSVYCFDVEGSATKPQIASAVRSVYKVSPRKIRIVHIPAKIRRSARTGKSGTKIGGKKAYVYLRSGETITIA